MGKKFNKNDNFLELVPEKTKGQDFIEDDDGLIKIIVVRNGILERVIRSILKTPKTMKIDLDKLGSCVWKAIDGKSTVLEIGDVVRAQFGEDAEPIYERLATYINVLRNNKFITLEKKDDGS